MAKISFTKLALKKNEVIKTIEINGQPIEVRQYLPLDNKIDLIDITLNQSGEEAGFYNPMKLDIFFHLNVIFSYTNISFTEKQKEDKFKLYDLLESNDIITQVIEQIPTIEYENLLECIEECARANERYHNSFVGALKSIQDSFDDTDKLLDKITEDISSSSELSLLKDIVTRYRSDSIGQ